MTAKNILIYLFQTLIGLAGHLAGLIIYPLAFIFRHKILAWANSLLYEDEMNHIYKMKEGVKWYHFISLYFPLFWFFTGLDNNHCGPVDYKVKLKEKWFKEFAIIFNFKWVDLDWYFEHTPDYFTLKRKLQYFWLCYCWEAFRNGFYNWSKLWREGKADLDSIIVIKDTNNLDKLIMPQPELKDGYLFYDFQREPGDTSLTTHEGSKLMTFTTYKGNHRFYYGYCRIHRLKKYLFVVNIMFGWGWYNGIRETKLKFIFLKLDDKALSDYNEYLKF